MAGPIIEALKKAISSDSDKPVKQAFDDSLLEDHAVKLQENMESGGCCGATRASHIVREQDD
jgi:hypothetical protein